VPNAVSASRFGEGGATLRIVFSKGETGWVVVESKQCEGWHLCRRSPDALLLESVTCVVDAGSRTSLAAIAA